MKETELVPINRAQALDDLSPIYHEHFQELNGLLSSNERLYATANCSSGPYLGFVVLTTFRVFKTIFENTSKWIETRKHVDYYKQKGTGNYAAVTYSWFPSPLDPLSSRDIKNKKTIDFPFTSVTSIDRKEYKPTDSQGKTYHILDLSYLGAGRFAGNTYLSGHLGFDYPEGQRVYELSMHALHHGGKIEMSLKDDLLAELERLSKLYQDGLLSSEQFEAAKNKLLKE